MRQKKTNQEVEEMLEKKNLYGWDGVYISANTPLNCKCKICNGYCHPRYDSLQGGWGGCIKCGVEKCKNTTEEIMCMLEKKGLYNWDNVYVNSKTPLNCKCKICNSDCYPSYHNLQNNIGGCKFCGRLTAAKATNNSVILYHWQTGKEIVCVGSYETKTVDGYLNTLQINYLWQPKFFVMPDGRTYTPDLYLPHINLWVEIKGYFWGDALEKWEWFHKEYPNSALWNADKLTEMGIL